jgi:hypothetical protein
VFLANELVCLTRSRPLGKYFEPFERDPPNGFGIVSGSYPHTPWETSGKPTHFDCEMERLIDPEMKWGLHWKDIHLRTHLS